MASNFHLVSSFKNATTKKKSVLSYEDNRR